MKFKFIKTTDPEYARERALRWEMLHKPMGLPPGSELYPEDEKGLHLIAMDKKEVVGCLLFYPENATSGKLVQFAFTDMGDQHQFRKLLHYLEKHLFEKGFSEITCSVKPDLVSFYEKLGFNASVKASGHAEETIILSKKLHES